MNDPKDPFGFDALEDLGAFAAAGKTSARRVEDDEGRDVPAADTRPRFPCVDCGYFLKSQSDRFAAREKARARKAEVKARAQREFNEAEPGLIAFLTEASRWSEFAQNLVSAFHQYGSLTPNQTASARRMYEKVNASKLARAEERKAAERPVDLSVIQKMFDTAASKGLKRPQYRAEGLAISCAPAHGRNPGALYVKAIDNDVYLGMVVGGVFKPRREAGDNHRAALATIAANPLEAAVKYGRLSGRCAICSRLLTAEDSVERGIGPICAANMGL